MESESMDARASCSGKSLLGDTPSGTDVSEAQGNGNVGVSLVIGTFRTLCGLRFITL
jgi:hypothetical protein